MRKYLLVAIAVAVLMISCKKDENLYIPPPTAVLLKDIAIPGLPSPYYYFEYSNEKKVTNVSHASGIWLYDAVYAAGLLSELRNNTLTNKDRLVYIYNDNGRPGVVKYINENGVVFKRAHIYYGGGQLKRVEWERKADAGYVMERTIELTYYADGNLAECRSHAHLIPGSQNEVITIDRFEQYDNKVNVDAFSLLHPNGDHLLLLPGIMLQKSNPRKVTRTGTGINYIIDYTYTYNDKNAPLSKTGDALFTSGPNNGQRFQTSAGFTYY